MKRLTGLSAFGAALLGIADAAPPALLQIRTAPPYPRPGRNGAGVAADRRRAVKARNRAR